jgi:rod shape determining protein RodA
VRFQPSEIMKLAVPMLIAWYLHPRVLPPGLGAVAVAFILLLGPALLIARQPDLGTALLMAASGCIAIFLSGLRWRVILAWPAWRRQRPGAVAGHARLPAPPRADLSRPGVRSAGQRLEHHPVEDRRGLGRPARQGLAERHAVAPGVHSRAPYGFHPGRAGRGIRAGGRGVLLFLYLFIAGRAPVIAGLAKDTYSRLLAGSLGLTFFVYVCVNAGMVSGLLPVVGVPLPLVSYGGTSIVTLLAGFGIVMSIHGHRNFHAVTCGL